MSKTRKKLDISKNLYEKYEVCNQDQERLKEYPFLVLPLKKCADKNGTLIDVGCGRGYFFPFYLEMGIKKQNIIGVDFSKNAINTIVSGGFRGIVHDITNMYTVESNSADLVLAIGSLHHTHSLQSALDECIRLLDKRSELIVNLYNIWHPYWHIIHRLTLPLRALSYLLGTWFTKLWSPPFLLAFQIQNYLRRKKLLNCKDLWAVFYDQVMIPYAHLSSRSRMKNILEKNGLEILGSDYNLSASMYWVWARKIDI